MAGHYDGYPASAGQQAWAYEQAVTPIQNMSAAHRAAFLREYPEQLVRPDYRQEVAAMFTELDGEDPADVDFVMQASTGKRALVIAASGYAFMNALARGVGDIDVIDNNPAQLAWTYACAAFVVMTPKPNAEERLEEFKTSAYNSLYLDSMAMPPLRQLYLDKLPKIAKLLAIPPELQVGVSQALAYHAFRFADDMRAVQMPDRTNLWELFYQQYDTIRDRLLNNTDWRLHADDLNHWLREHTETYDAIYTSNVHDYDLLEVASEQFMAGVAQALAPGGVGSITSLTSDLRLRRGFETIQNVQVIRQRIRSRGDRQEVLVFQKQKNENRLNLRVLLR